jgi:hypothetical protein
MSGIIAGGYTCRTHGTLYTFEATWQESGSHVTWSARVFYDRRLGETCGELELAAGADPGAAVREAVQGFIERVSCASARRGAVCGPTFGTLAS